MKVKPTSKPGQVTVELDRGDEQLMARSAAEAETRLWPFPLRNILVPTDFSDYSRQALQYALPLAEKFDAVISLLHVVEPQPPTDNPLVPGQVGDVNASLIKEGHTLLEELKRKEIKPGIVTKTMVTMGRPHQQIVGVAESLGTDLIIIATHGYTGLKHLLLGSTAERVVRHAPCPVLVVRKPAE